MLELKNIEGHNVLEYKSECIYIIEDLFDDEFCNYIIDIINKTISKQKSEYNNHNNVLCYGRHLDNLIWTDDTLFYKFSTNANDYDELLKKIKTQQIYTNINNGVTRKELMKTEIVLFDKIKIIQSIMSKLNKHAKINNTTSFILRKIFGGTRLHADGIVEIYDSQISYVNSRKNYSEGKNLVRTMSMICAFNDDHDGGEFNFPNQDIRLKLKKGSVILFPPYWTHPHEVSELLNKTYRYTMTTWFCDSSLVTNRTAPIVGYNK